MIVNSQQKRFIATISPGIGFRRQHLHLWRGCRPYSRSVLVWPTRAPSVFA